MANPIGQSQTKTLMDISARKPGVPVAKKEVNVAEKPGNDKFAKELKQPTNPKEPVEAANQNDLAAEQVEKQQDSQRVAERRQRRDQLRPLKQVANENRQALYQVPVLAFLNGRLDQLSPAAIPDLVSQNDFISNALAEGDMASFLNKDMSVGDVLEALNIPEPLVEQAVRSGLNLSQIVSPSDMLRTLGVDPSRVQVELTNLRDNMQTRGLASYMQKAAGLRGILPNQNELHDHSKPMASSPASVQGLGGNAGMTGVMPTIPNGLAQQQNLAQQSTMTPKPMHPLYNDAGPRTGMQQPMMQKAAVDPMGQMQGRMAQAQSVESLTVKPQMQGNLEDSLMAQKVSGGFNPAKLAAQPLTSNTLQSSALATPQIPSGEPLMFGAQPKATQPSTMNPVLVTQPQPNLQQVLTQPGQTPMASAPIEMASLIEGDLPKGMIANVTDAKPMQAKPASKAVSVDELVLENFKIALPDEASSESDPQSFGDSQEQPSQNLFGQNSFTDPLSTPSVTGVSKGFQATMDSIQEGPSTSERVEVIQKIMDQATALVKKGGGSLSLNLNNLGLGSLELAVNLQNERVDLKILTGSERVRDMISAELAGLRDALTVQKLDLGSVDVGVEGREQSQNNFMNQERQERQARESLEELQQTFAGMTQGLASDIELEAPRRIKMPMNMPINMSSNGNLEVRV